LKNRICVVGCGLSGAVTARNLAEKGFLVNIFEKRNHIGGNAFDTIDDNGILIHPYGPHIFHTNSKKVFSFLSRFTHWRFYEHEVLANVDNKLVPIPINRITLSELFNKDFSESDAKAYFEENAVKLDRIRTSEDNVVASVGEYLCKKFFSGYTKKQWGIELSELDASVAARIPHRINDDSRYFNDDFQFIPAKGYTRMIENILDHENIDIYLNTDYFESVRKENYFHTIYTGPIDRFFNFQFGRLEYRSLNFKHKHIQGKDTFQKVGTINFPNTNKYTRITEFKHITGQVCKGTSIVYEYPQSKGEPYYPVPRQKNSKLYNKYFDLIKEKENFSFIGRLAQYRYYNMDQAVAAALKHSKNIIENLK